MHAALTESNVSVLNMGGSLPAITDRELSSFSISISCWCCCCFFILATLAKDVATMQEDLSSSSGRFNGVVKDCCWCWDADAAAAVASSNRCRWRQAQTLGGRRCRSSRRRRSGKPSSTTRASWTASSPAGPTAARPEGYQSGSASRSPSETGLTSMDICRTLR